MLIKILSISLISLLMTVTVSLADDKSRIIPWAELGQCSKQDSSAKSARGESFQFKLIIPGITRWIGAGVFEITEAALSWPVQDTQGEQSKIELKKCIVLTEEKTILAQAGTTIKSDKEIDLCGFKFKGELKVTNNGIELSENSELAK